MKIRIRIQGCLTFLAIVITILFSKVTFPYWKSEPADEFSDALGIIFILFGFLFRVTARGYKEEKSQQGKFLVKEGPYYLMRHPMYFGTLLIGIGIIAVLFKFWVLPVFLIIYFLIYFPQINREEKSLLKKFGQEYIHYCKTTPKYFPKVSLNFREYLPLELSWIKKELPSLIVLIVLILGIEIWEEIRLFGYKELIKETFELLAIILSLLILINSFRTSEEKNDYSQM
ncbi:MAG: isoprenylcysteine carboxylmethyltransferase family protein [Candidatus Omnitrophica bacterium]|nr:isoprenylcysteine carboxylmethyltransferase family protein [Candidatus Omnitrophota bacterium]MCM8826441.1 isoprenylcysteine carboxylmethyltransferase family protein [Candidatus Omnitrophota bacterium]